MSLPQGPTFDRGDLVEWDDDRQRPAEVQKQLKEIGRGPFTVEGFSVASSVSAGTTEDRSLIRVEGVNFWLDTIWFRKHDPQRRDPNYECPSCNRRVYTKPAKHGVCCIRCGCDMNPI